MKEKVLQAMKPKVASLGFTTEELESAATQIAGTLQEDATEDRINAQVDAVIPFLKLSQSAATRIVNAQKKKEEKPKKETEKEAGSENPEEDKFDKLLKVIEEQNKKIDSLVNKDVTATRRNAYAAKLKELPDEIQKTKLKDFDRMNFKDQEDFDSFMTEVDEDIPAIVQGLANKGLSEMGKPIVGGKSTDKQASDKEVKDVINQLNI